MSEHSLRSEIVSVTPEMARHLRSSCNFERQRDINKYNVQRLTIEMKRGRFIQGTPIFMAVYPDGSMAILNGNHTLESIASSGVTIPLTFIYAPVQDINEAGRIYARFDLQKSRTWVDAYLAAGIQIDAPRAWITRLGGAMAITMRAFKRKTGGADEIETSRDLRIDFMQDYHEVVSLVAVAATGAPIKNVQLVSRAPVLAVALEGFRYQAASAHEFWRAVMMDDKLGRNDPRKLLLEYLRDNMATTANRVDQSKAAMLAWNAWFRKREMTRLRVEGFKTMRIEGTPWDGTFNPLADFQQQKAATKISLDYKPSFETGTEMGRDGVSRPVSTFHIQNRTLAEVFGM